MAELKTRPTAASVKDFLGAVAPVQRRDDCLALAKLMRKATGSGPKMWGPSIVGFGRYHYRYASGREGDWFRAGFSPRKQDLTIYLMAGFAPPAALMKRLGKHKAGKCCLYIKRLADVDRGVLEELIRRSLKHTAACATSNS